MGQTIANVFYKQRADFLEEQKERDKRLKFPDDVEEIRDIPYLKDGLKAHHLDVYKSKIITPEQEHRKLPVIINVPKETANNIIIGSIKFRKTFGFTFSLCFISVSSTLISGTAPSLINFPSLCALISAFFIGPYSGTIP